MFTFLQFEAIPLIERVLKKRHKKTYLELMEFDLAMVAFYGIISLLGLSLLANSLGALTLAEYSLYFIYWNLVPFGQLDGLKIFMGSAGPLKKTPIPVLYLFTLILVGIVSSIVLF